MALRVVESCPSTLVSLAVLGSRLAEVKSCVSRALLTMSKTEVKGGRYVGRICKKEGATDYALLSTTTL